MRHVGIPRTELNVSPLCLGTGDVGAAIPLPESLGLLDEFVALGGNFIDTAHVYSDWIPGTKSTSEKTLGRWMKDRGNRADLVIATKGGHPELATMHVSRLSREEINRDISESLDYLQTEVIDLYWLHYDDQSIPVGELVDILNEQVEIGTIRYFGASNWTTARITAALAWAVDRNIHAFVANQARWSLGEPNSAQIDPMDIPLDAEGLEFHERTGMALIPYSSQAQGFFSDLDRGGMESVAENKRRLFENPTNLRRLGRIREVARSHGAEVDAVVLAYLLAQPFTVIPIIGPRRIDQLRSSMKALDVSLTPDDVMYLESA